MKSFPRIIASSLFVLLTAASTSFAALNSDTVYMVKGDNDYTLSLNSSSEYSYTLDQTPWAYLKLSLSDLNTSSPLFLLWSWSSFTDGSVNESKFENLSLSGLTGDKEIWRAAPEPWWTNNKAIGKWTVDLAWINPAGAIGMSSANFTVTPEPMTGLLLLFGGAPLAAGLLRKKKQIA